MSGIQSGDSLFELSRDETSVSAEPLTNEWDGFALGLSDFRLRLRFCWGMLLSPERYIASNQFKLSRTIQFFMFFNALHHVKVFALVLPVSLKNKNQYNSLLCTVKYSLNHQNQVI